MRFFPSRHLILGVLVFLTLGVNAIVAYLNIGRLIGNERSVSLTFTVNDDLDTLLSLVNDMETSESSFIATGQERPLITYRTALVSLKPALDRIAVESADPQQRDTLVALRKAFRNHQKLAQKSIELRRKSGIAPAQAFFTSHASRQSRDDIEHLLDQMRIREQEILEGRASDSNEAAQDATRTFWIATGTEIAFLTLILVLLWRTARQNYALERAFDDLKRAEEMRDNLTAMLVHDLRTPLTSLLGPLNMLGSGMLGPLDSVQNELVTMSEQSGQRLLNLVNELLDISKMEAGEFQIHREPVEVGDVVQQAIGGVRVFDGGHGAHMQVDVETPHQVIEADADLLVRVLINLIGNALKFTPAEGTITVGAQSQDQELRFWVRDTGRGIPPEYADKIFEKFGQVESRAQGQRFSTGLGLTFCKLAVEAHGGQIWVESEVDKGSTFWFSLPLSTPHRDSASNSKTGVSLSRV